MAQCCLCFGRTCRGSFAGSEEILVAVPCLPRVSASCGRMGILFCCVLARSLALRFVAAIYPVSYPRCTSSSGSCWEQLLGLPAFQLWTKRYLTRRCTCRLAICHLSCIRKKAARYWSQVSLTLVSARDCYEIVRPSSFFETPSASSDFISKSIDTVGSPASIFATLD